MRGKFFLTIIIVLLTDCSLVQNSPRSLDKRRSVTMFQIKRIQRHKSHCIIYAARNDSTFKILSWVDNPPVNGTKIRIGESYQLELETVYPLSKLLGIPIAANGGIKKGLDITRDGKKFYWVKAEEKSHNSLYIARNLNGVYLIE